MAPAVVPSSQGSASCWGSSLPQLYSVVKWREEHKKTVEGVTALIMRHDTTQDGQDTLHLCCEVADT